MLYGSGFHCKGRDSQRQCSLYGAKCAVPTDHLCSEISFSRTSNSPDLISYIHRIASVTLETLYCLCVYMVAQLHAHWNKHLLSVHFSEGTLPRWVVNRIWGVASRFFMHTAVLHWVWSSFRWGSLVIVGCYNGSRTRGSKRLKTTALCKYVASKKTFNLIWIMLKILQC